MKSAAVLGLSMAGLAPVFAEAATVSGSFNIITLGVGSEAADGSSFDFGTSVYQTAQTGTFGSAALTPLTVNATLLTPATTSVTGDNVSDLFSVGNYQFNLTSVQLLTGSFAAGNGSLLAVGTIVDTSGTYTPSTAAFTLSESGSVGSGFNYSASFSAPGVAPVPLPAAVWMMLAGLGGIGAFARRRDAA